MQGPVQAFVMGRLSADLYPQQIETPLEKVSTFERFVGGFAGNVSTAMARLGVRVAIISGVGDDGHGRFIRDTLQAEGVDTTWLVTNPILRTALAFCEMWPPDRFPITFYREPTCPDWELRPGDLPLDELARAPLFYMTGTGLAREPSRTATLTALERRAWGRTNNADEGRQLATIFDLDWRESLWHHPSEYPLIARLAARFADTLLGSDEEFAAAGLAPEEAFALGVQTAVVKHGPDGATVLHRGEETRVPGLVVPAVNGLGAGDAFAGGYGAGLLAGLSPEDAVRRANAAGAIVVTRVACSAAMPRPPEIDAVLAGAPIVDGVVQPAPA